MRTCSRSAASRSPARAPTCSDTSPYGGATSAIELTKRVALRDRRERTIGPFLLIDGLVTWTWGADQKFMPAPFGNRVYHVGDVALARQDVGILIITLGTVLLLWAFFRFTKIGLGMRAAAVRPAAARLV